MRSATSAFDAASLGLAGLCLLHCLALPLLALALPLAGVLAEAEWVHILLVAIAAPLTATALLQSHGRLAPSAPILLLGLLGLALLGGGAFGPAAYEQSATVAGSLVLAAAHILNWRRRARAHARPAHLNMGSD